MLKIALIGYGQMGKLIEQLTVQNDCEIVAKIDPLLGNEITAETLANADVCIEFSTPDAAYGNLTKLIKLGKNVVTGTTGWFNELDKIKLLVEEAGTGFVYGSNYSIGMNLFFSIVETTAKLMNQAEDYDLYGLEMHHNKKKDSPSGTAKVLSEIILKNIDRKTKAQYEKLDRRIDKSEFHFGSIRSGDIPGMHSISFDSEADTIELKHTARNRNGLALGAIRAAKWINKKTGFYNFTDNLTEIIG
ncbi:MAG: 4-hydroxy-tetrahydrodipicolinate reductase [Candidatus Cloacimonetes bacterium]|jgi:4-hydroxy-tetrahydrodipicolinate reductase|nr:4-hydroxy-tetrahydrodipicolinate reductase [Candidatus Cloacimonadota bacterium]